MRLVAESLGALSALVGVTQVEEAVREGGSDVIESRVHRRCGGRAVGAVVLLGCQVGAPVGRTRLAHSLFLKGTRVRAGLGGRQHEELVLGVERSRAVGREDEEARVGSVSVHLGNVVWMFGMDV
jgi:hypothetical protein